MRETNDRGAESLLQEIGWARALARSLVRDASVAEDLVQETCLAMLGAAPASVPRPRGFLRAIVRNAWRARVRSESARRERERAVAASGELPSAEELALRMERQRLIAEAVLELDEPFRSTVILRYLDGLEPAEIARRQGVPAGTVRRRLKTALERLRERLDRVFDGDRRSWAVALVPLLDLKPASILDVVGLKTTVVAGALAMKKTLLVACLLVLAAGTAAVGVLVRDRDAPPSAPAPSESLSAARGETGAANSSEAQIGAARNHRDRTEAPSPATPDTRDTARVTGRVVLPAGCERDETLEVLALDRPFSYSELARLLDEAHFDEQSAGELSSRLLARATVDDQGGFQLALPARSGHVHLAARGRAIYSPDTQPVELGRAAAEVALVLRAGVWLAGRIETRDGRGAEVSGTLLRLTGTSPDLTPAAGIVGRGFGMDMRVGADGLFELCAVPADLTYALFVLPEKLAAQKIDLSGLAPCGRSNIAVVLSSGATVRGKVADPEGRPIADAEVEALLPGRWMGLDDRRVRLARTDGAGEYELRGVPASMLRLRASKPGFLDSEKREIEPAEGAIVSGIELALGPGRALAGRVVLAGGGPAAGAEITAEFDQAFLANETTLNARRGAQGAAKADGEGRFAVEGLGDGPFVVRAAVEGPNGTSWRARRDGVRPDGTALELELHPPIALGGVVIDSSGVPVPDFEVHAVRIVEGALGAMGMTRKTQRFADAQGRFALEDLDQGDWSLEAEAPGFISAEAKRVQLPLGEAGGRVQLVLEPAASIAGHVLEPDGDPAAGAEVRVETSLPSGYAELAPGRAPPSARAGADGSFRLENLAAGPVRVVAGAAAALDSEPAELDLVSGQRVEGVVLALRLGARLTGEVYDDRGRPAAGDVVHLEDARGAVRFTPADERGRFAFAELAPGAWKITAVDMEAAVAPPSGTSGMDAMIGSVRLARVDLSEGENEHIVIGTASPAAVRVHGTVSQGGRPRGGGWIAFAPATGGGPERIKLASVDRDGDYEVMLGGRGAYIASVQQMLDDDEGTVDFAREIPAAGTHRLDFALPAGRIAGRVLAPDGAPAAGARVTVVSDGSTHTAEYSLGQYTEVLADSGGRFDVPGLRGGSYSVAAGGPSDDGACFARVVREELELADGKAIDDLELRLPMPGSIAVVARGANGEPIDGAAIFVRDQVGTVVDPLSPSATDEHGRGAYGCIAPGTYTVLARAGALASQESAPVRVSAGGEAMVELVLLPGTRLRVELKDRDGRPVNGWVYVLDSAGREVGNMYAAGEVDDRYFAGDFSPSAPVFGPLPPGRYVIAASAPGGLAATRELALSGEPEASVAIELAR